MVCVLCGKRIRGYGSSADPVKDGRCCDKCHVSVVIPARIRTVKESKEQKERSENNGNVPNLPPLRRKP